MCGGFDSSRPEKKLISSEITNPLLTQTLITGPSFHLKADKNREILESKTPFNLSSCCYINKPDSVF